MCLEKLIPPIGNEHSRYLWKWLPPSVSILFIFLHWWYGHVVVPVWFSIGWGSCALSDMGCLLGGASAWSNQAWKLLRGLARASDEYFLHLGTHWLGLPSRSCLPFHWDVGARSSIACWWVRCWLLTANSQLGEKKEDKAATWGPCYWGWASEEGSWRGYRSKFIAAAQCPNSADQKSATHDYWFWTDHYELV